MGYQLSADTPVWAVFGSSRVRVSWLSPIELKVVSHTGPMSATGELSLVGNSTTIGPLHVSAVMSKKEGDTKIHLQVPARTDGEKILRLARKSRETSSSIASDILPAEVIVDRKRIRRVIGALSANGCECLVGSANDKRPTTVAYLSPDLRLMMEWSHRLEGPPFHVYLIGWFSLFRFRAPDLTGKLKTPDRLVRFRQGRTRRVPAPPGVKLTVQNPLWPDIRVERELRDMSWDGLSFFGCREDDLLFPGMRNCKVEVTWKGGPTIQLSGVVAHDSRCSLLRDGKELCGIRINDSRSETTTEWQRAITPVLYPTTNIARESYGELWELYEHSGYFSISGKNPANFANLRESYYAASRRLGEAQHLGAHVVWPGGKRFEAAVTVVKTWQTAVFAYQLARRGDARPISCASHIVLRDILSHTYEYVQRYPNIRWYVVYVPDEVRFSRYIALDFPARYDDGDRVAITKFCVFQDSVAGSYGARGYQVSEASDSECGDLLAIVRRSRPRAYAEATDVVSERLRLNELREEWGAAGMRRARRVFAARQNGQAVAFAVADLVEEGVHLFGLMDCVRLFAATEYWEEAYPALLDTARRWYAEHAKQRFVLIDETPDKRIGLGARMPELGGAQGSFMTVDLIVDMLEYIYEVTAPGPFYRPPRRGSY